MSRLGQNRTSNVELAARGVLHEERFFFDMRLVDWVGLLGKGEREGARRGERVDISGGRVGEDLTRDGERGMLHAWVGKIAREWEREDEGGGR